jgi:protein TonB
MVPPKEIEKEQPATLPADFSEWDSGDVPATQPAIPATARVAVSSVADRLPDSASHTSTTAHEEAERVFQPRQSQGVNESDEEFGEKSKGSHKGMVLVVALVLLVILFGIILLGYSRSWFTTVMPKQPVVPQPAMANTPQPVTTTSLPQTATTTNTPAPVAATTAPDRLRPQSEMMNHQLDAPARISNDLKMLAGKEAPPPSSGFAGAGMEGLGGGGAASNVFSGQNGPKVKVEASKKMSISAGVAGGLLVQKTAPNYPQIAKEARVSGTVVIQATISKAGSIENLHVVNGPTMLRQAALDAVKTWRYRPYLLDGEPVEVETTVNVAFSLGGR